MMTTDAVDAVRAERRLKLLTASRARDARGCKRLHHLQYDLGYRPVFDADELRFGTLGHLGLEAWWKAKQAGLPQDEWLRLAQETVTAAESNPFDLARIRVLLTGYHLRWKDEPFEVLAVEVRFETELRNPGTGAASRTWRLGGKIDVIARDLRDGLAKVIEHKFSGEDITAGSNYWKRLRMDDQVSTYFDGGVALGFDIAECIYDVVGKPGARPKMVPVLDEHGNKVVLNAKGERVRKAGGGWRQTADKEQGFVLQTREETVEEFTERIATVVGENSDQFYQRGAVPRLEKDLEDARFDRWQLAGELNENERARRYPRNPSYCERYNRFCAFFDVCCGVASLEDTSLFTRSDSVHPELAGEPVGAQPPKEMAPT